MLEKEIILEAKSFVFDLFKNKLPREAVYHNFEHTQSVVTISDEIAQVEKLDESKQELLILAAWFHDTGYTQGHEKHEENSVKIATEFLSSRNYSKDKIEFGSV